MDLACTVALVVLLSTLGLLYAVRVARSGRAKHPRVEAEGESALLAKSAMEMLCWCAGPVVTACAKLRISPDAVTFGALGFGVAAGVAFGVGHFGLGAVLATAGGAADAIDGLLARRLGTASDAGEVLDAAVDRYVDFAWLAGLAYYFRDRPAPLVLAFLALLASVMVSYSTAKAEALKVVPPRGSMRRVERAVLIVAAAALTPITALLGAPFHEAPILLALVAIAFLGNESAVRRLAIVRATVRSREARVVEQADAAPPEATESAATGRAVR